MPGQPRDRALDFELVRLGQFAQQRRERIRDQRRRELLAQRRDVESRRLRFYAMEFGEAGEHLVPDRGRGRTRDRDARRPAKYQRVG